LNGPKGDIEALEKLQSCFALLIQLLACGVEQSVKLHCLC